MATIPFQNFVFTDPVAAQQATQMAQILQAAQAEKDRNFTSFANEITRSGTARNNAAQQRAMTQGQMNQQSSEAEKNRQARALEIDKDITSREKIAGMGMERTKTNALIKRKFDTIASLVESDDPPTDAEFGQLVQDLDEGSVLQLKAALDQNRTGLLELANEAKQLADFWNPRFKVIPDTESHKSAKAAFAKDRRAQELIIQDPKTMEFVPKYTGPRMDAAPQPGIAAPKVTSILDLKSSMGESAALPGVGFSPRPPIGFIPRETDFAVPAGGPIMDDPPAALIDPYQPRFTIPRMTPLGY